MKRLTLIMFLCLLCFNQSIGQNVKSQNWYIKHYDKNGGQMPSDTISLG